MKRRKFIYISTAVTISLMVPQTGCSSKNSLINILASLESLSNIYNIDLKLEIGKKYMEIASDESAIETLSNVISKRIDVSKDNKRFDEAKIKNKIHTAIIEDFERGEIITVDGWILSLTEARQCALLSLIQN